MNFADSEVVNSILIEDGMKLAENPESADVVLVNTCSIRENAETKVWNRLKELRKIK
ncbi:MAG TPA: tRNA (N6-isopentenyl adenosine(37)-C2)-methylthiotransferase MiaB, partial [Balneola sp.]|nr:tRNA (N6-isopentenyl adenosine(37)-C2)-methylthiotransferase MiaB [Balneola sp.]